MEYRELAGLALHHEWAANYKATIDADNVRLLAQRQARLDKRNGIGVGDFVLVSDGVYLRVAHDWGDGVQLTDRQSSGSFYLGDGFVEYSGSLDPTISKDRFSDTGERKAGRVWFFSQDHAKAHNGYETEAFFRVWRLEAAK